MSKTRFTQWIVLACMGAVAACTSGEGGTVGNTEVNVIVPNGAPSLGGGSSAPGLIDIQSVEYTINCLGNDSVFLENNATFPDEVRLEGNLEVVDGRTNIDTNPNQFGTARPGDGAEVWQAFMDLPPGPCTIQLRARDNDGEVICTATEPFFINADTLAKVNLVLVCDVSFQAPVGMLDVDATFSFVVSNFCPDLFVLNCLDSNPVEQIVAPPPIPPVAVTTCEVRFRDGDSTCGQSCDPQTCGVTPEGIDCTPGPDNGVSTTVTCTDGRIDCDFNALTTETSCVFNGDTLGNTPVGGPIVPNTPGDGAFAASCIPPALGGTPGAVVVCTAVTTDGDIDCNKTKTVSINCPGLTPCEQFGEDNGQPPTQAGGDAACDALNTNDCQSSACDGSSGTAVCVDTDLPNGTVCTSAPAPATCDGAGTCVSQDCNAQPDPDGSCDDGNECTTDTCDAPPATSCSNTPNTGAACAGSGNPGDGTCDAAGVCQPNNECSVAGDCPNTPPAPQDPQCTAPVCNTAPFANVCETVVTPGIVCDFNPGAGDGQCTAAGACIFAPPTCGLQQQTVSVGCVNNVTTAQSPFPFQLSVDVATAIIGGGTFSATLDGVGFFPEFFLNAAQNVVPGGVRQAQLVAFVSTVAVRSGATGPNVPLTADLATLSPGPVRFCNFPTTQTCTCPGGTAPGATCANAACLGGTCNAEVILQDLPVVNGIPLSAGGCDTNGGLQAPPACDCSPCAALDTPPDTTKVGQCNLNGFCQNGDLVIQFASATGSYTAGPSGGDVLWGWTDNGIVCPSTGACTAPFHVQGCLDIPPAGTAAPTFGSPAAPIGIRVNASGLAVPIQCAMGVDGGNCSTTLTLGCTSAADCPGTETCVGVGVDDDIICPTPDSALIACPIF